MSEIVLYKAKDGHVQIEVSLTNNTLWLSQRQMADLFGTNPQAITKHLIEIKLNENGLVALALLIAESDPAQKEMMVRLVVNFLID